MVSALASSSVGFPFIVSVILKVLVSDWDLLEEKWEKQNIYFVCLLMSPHQCPSSPAHVLQLSTLFTCSISHPVIKTCSIQERQQISWMSFYRMLLILIH